MALKTYDPKKVQIVIGGNIMSGFMDGTFLTVERDADSYNKHTGTDGDVTRTKTNNRAGMATLTLAASSASNDILSALVTLDELSDSGVVAFLVKDNSGRTLLESPEAWIRKPANSEFGDDMTAREWVIDLSALNGLTGGN